MLLALVASWLAPLALAAYPNGDGHACCRRSAHHCRSANELAFRDGKPHCTRCQAVAVAHQAPRIKDVAVGIVVRDEHPFAHEFSSAYASDEQAAEQSQRAPPLQPTR